MKFVVLANCLAMVIAGEVMVGYHGPIGIPAARRLRQTEGVLRITGGMPVPTGRHPYFAGLLITLTTGASSVCGGTLVSSKKVLTAARCWYDGFFQGRSITVVLGTYRLYYGGRRLTASSVYTHPDYHPYLEVNDIAMISIPVTSFNSDISPAKLPLPNNETYVGKYAHIVGYGKTSDWGGMASEQHDAALPVISKAQCTLYFGSLINDKTLCTSGVQGWGACGGDTGGPLVLDSDSTDPNLLIGVISFRYSKGCQSGYPTGYTRVASFLPWINSLL